MQTNVLSLASGIHKFTPDHEAEFRCNLEKDTMSKTATIAIPSSNGLFGRLLASIDRLLMLNANIAVRNGDQPHFGL